MVSRFSVILRPDDLVCTPDAIKIFVLAHALLVMYTNKGTRSGMRLQEIAQLLCTEPCLLC
jgi:hypothetical protein